ncbi:Mlp family lipoprotein (plasmid) [Borrelia puertoricensis]|uniref:Mlp family lipoprotein n=1 Tax=Borrelia puertoricensis TaxID=2756107 RepID=UPI003EBE4093
MNKYIKLTILCSLLLLCCCGGHKLSMVPKHTVFTSNPKNDHLTNLQEGNKAERNSEEKPKEVITLTDNEKEKFDVLINGFDKILELDPYFKIDSNPEVKKSSNFLNWLRLIDISKKKELANLFIIVYDFLKDKKPPKLNNLTINQLVSNTIACQSQNQCNNTYNNIQISTFFRGVLSEICSREKTNEEIFEYLKEELLNPSNHVAGLIGEEIGERTIKIKLKNDNKRMQAFNFLKSAFPQDIQYIMNNVAIVLIELKDDAKLKAILDHINTELKKCNGNEASENAFSNRIREYFVDENTRNTINAETLDKFQNSIVSTCQTGVGG